MLAPAACTPRHTLHGSAACCWAEAQSSLVCCCCALCCCYSRPHMALPVEHHAVARESSRASCTFGCHCCSWHASSSGRVAVTSARRMLHLPRCSSATAVAVARGCVLGRDTSSASCFRLSQWVQQCSRYVYVCFRARAHVQGCHIIREGLCSGAAAADDGSGQARRFVFR